MAISLKNHEDRIKALEVTGSRNMKVLFSTTFNQASYTPKTSEPFTNWKFLLVDSNIERSPGWGSTTTLISTEAIKAGSNCFAIGNDDNAVSYFKFANDNMSLSCGHSQYNFLIFKITGLNLYYKFRDLFKEVSRKWLSL